MNEHAVTAPATSGKLKLRQVGAYLGAEARGVDLSQPLDQEMVEALKIAHAEFGVLVFPDQKIDGEDLKRFGRYFGDLTVHPFSTSTKDNPELIVYDNKEGNPPPPTDVWHTDETFREAPPMGTILCSKVVPDVGGDTNFCSMTAVWEGLSDRMQSFVSGLEAVHDYKPFRKLFPDTPKGREAMRKYDEIYPPTTHPVVTQHPVTGRKALFVNPQFTLYIKGMEEYESQTILEMLYRRTFTNEYHYRHRWSPDTVVFWDNRWTQHSALHDYYPKRRMMHRVTVSGTKPIPAFEAADPATLRRLKAPPVTDFKDRPKRQFELD